MKAHVCLTGTSSSSAKQSLKCCIFSVSLYVKQTLIFSCGGVLRCNPCRAVEGYLIFFLLGLVNFYINYHWCPSMMLAFSGGLSEAFVSIAGDPNTLFWIKVLLISMVALYKVTFEHQLVLNGERKACMTQFHMRWSTGWISSHNSLWEVSKWE